MRLKLERHIHFLCLFGVLNLIILEIVLLIYERSYILEKEGPLNLPVQNSAVNKARNMQYVKYNANVDFGVKPHPLLPSGIMEMDDRIEEQLRISIQNHTANNKTKVIIDMASQVPSYLLGQKIFLERDCPVSDCIVNRPTVKKGQIVGTSLEEADAVLLGGLAGALPKFPHQIWIFSRLESPINTIDISSLNDKINWTYTYRRDSTIVTPYFKYKSYGNFSKNRQSQNYATGKQKLIAWFVSNCNSQSGRLKYVDDLRKFIPVDVFGSCGNFSCKHGSSECGTMLDKDYKFYLSYENSLCKDYITEKLLTALEQNIVPVVLGASYRDYLLAAPPNSFIHVDNFTSPRELADHLWYLHKNDQEYNKYFQWKNTGYFMDTKTICRICAMLHADLPPVWYTDIATWWSKDKSCHIPKNADKDIVVEWLNRIYR